MADRERCALIVVTSTYEDAGLGALRAPADDAEALAQVLADPDIGGFEVEVLADPDTQRLRLKVEDFFADRSPRHTLLLHFSCHGVKNTAGKLFLASKDTRSSRLASTAVPAEYVSSLMLSSRAQRAVVLLDCCYSGAFAHGILARSGTDAHVEESFQDLDHMGTRRGRAVFTASSSIQFALEPDGPVPSTEAARELRPSMFTGALVEGLRTGEADRDGDGRIGMSELADYVMDRVADQTSHQTPHLWLFGVHGGDVAIARSRARAAATSLPPELEQGVRSSSREERLQVVEPLGDMLRGNDVGLALSARTALATLEHDDSRKVSEDAERMIFAARPRVLSDSIDLGTMVMGTPGPQTLLTVKSPPVARATMEARTVPWLKTRYTTDGILLSAAPAEPGHYEGDVLLRTATGEIPVHVGFDAVVEVEADKNAPEAQQQLRILPFVLVSALLLCTAVTPLIKSGKFLYAVFDVEAWDHYWFIPAIVGVGLATNAIVTGLALRQSPYLCRALILAFYTAITSLTLAAAGEVLASYVHYSPFIIWVGSVSFGLAGIFSIWGSIALWRHRWRRVP